MVTLTLYMAYIAIIGCLAEVSNSDLARKAYLKSVFIFAFLYSALRGPSVGIDTIQYNRIFSNIAENGLAVLPRNTEMEKGYMFLCWLLSKVINNPQIIIAVTSGVICLGFYTIIKEYSEDYMLSSLIFVATVFTVTLNVARQYMALAIVFFAMKSAFQKEKIKTIILLALAVSIHYSAAIFLPVILLSLDKFYLNKRKVLIIGGISFLAVPLYMTIITIVTAFLPQYARFLESAVYSSEIVLSKGVFGYFAVVLILAFCSLNSIRISGAVIYRDRIDTVTTEEEHELVSGDIVYLYFLIFFIEYIVVYLIS